MWRQEKGESAQSPEAAVDVDDDDDDDMEEAMSTRSIVWTALKLATAAAFFLASVQHTTQPVDDSTPMTTVQQRRLLEHQQGDNHSPPEAQNSPLAPFLRTLFDDLHKRKKRFDDTPPEEVKYWFEYTEPLQKYFYRFSRSRDKADYFEGRDDSGVVSARFVEEPGGTKEFHDFYLGEEKTTPSVLLENCLASGSTKRPERGLGSLWNDWFGGKSNTPAADRCRVLFTINTVGAGRHTTMLWETQPPPKHAEGPKVWTSEQETAATHLERNLEEINVMCKTGYIAARVQMLVCEPISPLWTDWMDSKLVDCGGKAGPLAQNANKLEDRPSPLQIVVAANPQTADTCHDLKSGFMEKRAQDLVLAPPYLDDNNNAGSDPSIKTTNKDLISSDSHDLYVSMKWSSLVTVRAVHAFLQASSDIAAATSSPTNSQEASAVLNGPSGSLLIPSFVRVAYVSEENSKVAKWRMHGDFFHPAAWEVCKDSFETTWIPHSLAKSGGTSSMCSTDAVDCGQWWIYFTELQMPTSPEVFANEVTQAPVQGGSNFFWMVTERQRQEIVKNLVCQNNSGKDCAKIPQAVIPLGDLESFLINYTPNTALGHKHVQDHRPGYSKAAERAADRQKVKERKQLKDQEDIEKALFDYTIYPAALFHKDATLKAARGRDKVLTKGNEETAGPQTCKSSYYDITITKPRPAKLGWCQAISRRGLCSLYSEFFRSQNWCREACGLTKDWSKVDAVPE